MSDYLVNLWQSTADLYARFGLDADSVPPSKRRRFLNEEVLELMEASLEDVIDPPFDAAVCEEAADVFVTVIGLLQAHQIPSTRLEAAIRRVIAKNDAKTPENGWALVGGKIRRVEPS